MTISILGCGWLGYPLAKQLIQHGFSVKGSTTSRNKISILKKSGIMPFVIDCTPTINGSQLQDFFDAQALVLTIPFRRHLSDPTYYYQQIKSVAQQIEFSLIDFVIFTSSTSVYADDAGDAKEEALLIPHNDRSRVLVDIENMLLKNSHFDATVVRFGGMYGGTRKIGQFLSGRPHVEKGNHPVNLIHLDDCLQIIQTILQKNIRQEVFNACSDHHPTRKEIYTQAAQALGLPPPQFILSQEGAQTGGKVVNNEKLKTMLGYKFLHPNPMESL